MSVRLAACEPCRKSKTACDHNRPKCSRCRDSNRSCNYRDRPFKRRKDSTPLQDDTPRPPGLNVSRATRVSEHRFPNPGYLGDSSHATIFDQIAPTVVGNFAHHASSSEHQIHSERPRAVQAPQIAEGARLIQQIHDCLQIDICGDLVDKWTTSGVNLALAGPFTRPCVDASIQIFRDGTAQALQLSKTLFSRSCRAIVTDAATTIKDFAANFCHDQVRWETIGLFCAAVTRAAVDVVHFRPLYETRAERHSFQRMVMHLADQCLELCLALDDLNDLQLILQYENFILHSLVDGDQSYHSWRKLGDVVSSLYALGYHEQVNSPPTAPFLRELRRAAFARAYSADKNVSLFLGRPPRIHRRYCRFELPKAASLDLTDGAVTACPQSLDRLHDGPFDYTMETRWSAQCAILKEQVLDILCEEDRESRTYQARAIRIEATTQWASLPQQYRLEKDLKSCEAKPIERDFMVSARLNHLHVLFLVESALVQHISEPGPELVAVSASMLSLSVEALILRDQLANSGTGLVWKIAYYGLPAAGIICLALLNRTVVSGRAQLPLQSIIQDLSVLVAQVEAGALTHFADPNFALLSRATETIKTVLVRILSDEDRTMHQSGLDLQSGGGDTLNFTWTPWSHEQDSYDFEQDFWLNLTEHPALVGTSFDAMPP